MENSAFEALYTGVYIFIFIAALTTTLYMFRNINELAENSYEYGKKVEGQTLIETLEENDTYLSPSDVISYYFNYVKKDIYETDADFANNVHVSFSDEYLNNTNLSYSSVFSYVQDNTFYIKATSLDDSNGQYSFTIYNSRN